MSASLIWKRCRLDDEVSKFMNYCLSDGDKYVCNNSNKLLAATDFFLNDIYSLPQGVDPKVRELYPLLQHIQSVSRGLSDYELEKMAQKINFTETYNTYNEDLGHRYLTSYDAPFNNTYFPDYNNLFTSNYSGLFDKYQDKSVEREFKTPTSYIRNGAAAMRQYDTSYGVSSDVNRRTPTSSFMGGGNLFNTSTYRSQGMTPGYLISSCYGDSTNLLATPNNLNFNNANTVIEDDVFDHKGQFTTAFQPGNEYKNQYTMVETPVADSTRRNQNLNDFASPFHWEANQDKYYNYNYNNYNNNNNNNVNPDYVDMNNHFNTNNFAGNYGHSNKRYYSSGDSRLLSNFNPDSPLRSLLKDDGNYYYQPEVTPQRPYYS